MVDTRTKNTIFCKIKSTCKNNLAKATMQNDNSSYLAGATLTVSHLCIILVSMLFIFSLVSTVYAVCCIDPASENFCTAITTGCANDKIDQRSCQLTACVQQGCCVRPAPDESSSNSCEYTTFSSCASPNSFRQGQICSAVTDCNKHCCVLADGSRSESYSATACIDAGGEYHLQACNDIDNSKATIFGRIKNNAGQGLANAVVSCGQPQATSDANGNYSLQVNTGSCTLLVTLAGYQQAASQMHTVTTAADDKVNKDVILTQDSQAVITIKGYVKDSAGIGISGVSIIFENTPAVTDATGYYQLIASVSTGTYSIKVSKTNYADQTKSLAVVAGQTYSVDFTLTSQTSATCGNSKLDPNEMCEINDDSRCEGRGCNTVTCQCNPTCVEAGYSCADASYLCSGSGLQIISGLSYTCATAEIPDGRVCCDKTPRQLPQCYQQVGTTPIRVTGENYCRCGLDRLDLTSSTDKAKYCCQSGSSNYVSTTQCGGVSSFSGLVVDKSNNQQPLSDVSIQVSPLYFTKSNSSSVTNFLIPEIPLGSYQLVASKSGYNDYIATVTIASGANTRRIELVPRVIDVSTISFTVLNIKGSPYANISLSIPSSVVWTSASLSRGPVLNMHTFVNTPSGKVPTVDRSLEWDKQYIYNITVYDNSIQIYSRLVTFFTGNEACKDKLTTNSFCGSKQCHDTKKYVSCTSQNPNDVLIYRLTCTVKNELQLAGSLSSAFCQYNFQTESVCKEEPVGQTYCTGGTQNCRTLGLPQTFGSYQVGNVLGLLYGASYNGEFCEKDASNKRKFCYYDIHESSVFNRFEGTYTVVDQCFNCKKDGLCQEYQSKASCERDNCLYGKTYSSQCKWQESYEGYGKGFCYTVNSDSTKYCSMCSTDNPALFNSNCTQEVCSKLGACIAHPSTTKCTACSESSTCEQFGSNKNGCTGQAYTQNPTYGVGFTLNGYPQNANIQCNSSTIIQKSQDTCNIGYCRFVNGNCIKDANSDGISDCTSENSVECNKEVIAPSTLLISPPELTTVKKSVNFATSGTVGATLYCISDLNGYCCPSNAVTGNMVTFPNEVYDFNNTETKKILWYYSQGKYGVPETIKSQELTIDTKPPQYIITYVVTDRKERYDTSDIVISITPDSDVRFCSDKLTGAGVSSQMANVDIKKSVVKQVGYIDLADGDYIYELFCEDNFGNRNTSVAVLISIDRIKQIKQPSPSFKTLNSSVVNLSMIATSAYTCGYERLLPLPASSQTLFSTPTLSPGGYAYSAVISGLQNLTYQYRYSCYIDATKSRSADNVTIIFTIDTKPPTSTLYIDNKYSPIIQNRGFIIPSSTAWYTNPTFKINCSDPAQGPPFEFGCNKIVYCINTTACVPNTIANQNVVTFSPVIVTSGKHSLCYYSVDAGYNKEKVNCVELNLDTKGPRIELLVPSPGFILGSNILNFNGNWVDQVIPTFFGTVHNVRDMARTVRDIESISKTGSTREGTFSGRFTLNNLYADENIITIEAQDASGVSSVISRNFYYDLTGPNVTNLVAYSDKRTLLVSTAPQSPNTIQYFAIGLGSVKSPKHEFGNILRLQITANDIKYTDIMNTKGTDVSGTVSLYSVYDQTHAVASSVFNVTNYDSIQKMYVINNSQLIEVGDYSLVILTKDEFNNVAEYVTTFSVNDTQKPQFAFEIINSDGIPVTTVTTGTYTVKITPSEPISQIQSIGYVINGKTKPVLLSSSSGLTLTGTITISTDDLDLRDLYNKTALFNIQALDTHGLSGTEIVAGKQFQITTIVGLEPVIVNPDVVSGVRTFFSQKSTAPLEGFVFISPDYIGLRDGHVVVMKSTSFADVTAAGWGEHTRAQTTTNPLPSFSSWDSASYNDNIRIISPNTIVIHDYTAQSSASIFQNGKYLEFVNHPGLKRSLYRIQSVKQANTVEAKPYIEVTLDSPIVGFGSNPTGATFTDTIRVHSGKNQDGYFSTTVQLSEGQNYFYVRSFKATAEGKKSALFTIIYDSTPPVLIDHTPYDGTVTGSSLFPIAGWIDPTGSKITAFKMLLNNNLVPASLTTGTDGIAKISYTPSSNLANGSYKVDLTASDASGYNITFTWNFIVDYDAPYTPDLIPAGLINDSSPVVQATFVEPVEVSFLAVKNVKSGAVDSLVEDLTPNMNADEANKQFNAKVSNALDEKTYVDAVEASRRITRDDQTIISGTKGKYFKQFTVDSTPPIIVSIQDPIRSPYLPARAVFTVNEIAQCKFDVVDNSYAEMRFSATSNEWTKNHRLSIFAAQSLQSAIYIKCKDKAGNIMPVSKRVVLQLESLRYPAPKIFIPSTNTIYTNGSSIRIVGSTFGEPNSVDWQPSIPLILAKSKYFSRNVVEFEAGYNLVSAVQAVIGLYAPPSPFTIDGTRKIITLRDELGIFKSQNYVEFTENKLADYSLYPIISVADSSTTSSSGQIIGQGNKKITFSQSLPAGLSPSQKINIFSTSVLPGRFDYGLPLWLGDNYLYAVAISEQGPGIKTEVYTLVRDDVVPRFHSFFPRNNEVVAETNPAITAIADGTYSKIATAQLLVDDSVRQSSLTYLTDYDSEVRSVSNLASSLHTVKISAVDQVNNKANASWSFIINPSVPNRPSIFPNNYLNYTSINASILFNREVDLISAKIIPLDSMGNPIITQSRDIFTQLSLYPGSVTRYITSSATNYNEGAYVVEVKASLKGLSSSSNNVGVWYEPFWLDITKPSITDIPKIVSTNVLPLKMRFFTSEDAICKYSELDQSFDAMIKQIDSRHSSIHDGTFEIRSNVGAIFIRCKDKAGNVMIVSEIVLLNNGAAYTCGDGVITNPEQCDGSNWGEIKTCNDLNKNFKIGGSLSCDPKWCVFNTSLCRAEDSCVLNTDCASGQICVNNTCKSAHCTNNMHDSSAGETGIDCGGECEACPVCGNAVIERGETCDGTNFGPIQNCSDLDRRFIGGSLRCQQPVTANGQNIQFCHFDTSQCIMASSVCGDGVLQNPEQCEGTSVGNATCTNLGFISGTLSCKNCRYDTSVCQGSVGTCGNSITNIGEQCDGSDTKFTACVPYAQELKLPIPFTAGVISCKSCIYDISGCTSLPRCGDSILSPSEECEMNTVFGPNSCTQFDSFVSGMVSCNPTNCTINTNACQGRSNISCGDGIVQPYEQCEPSQPVISSCINFDSYTSGILQCTQSCMYDTTHCKKENDTARCGDGKVTDNEQCDGTDLGQIRTCTDYNSNFIGGTISCDQNICRFDTSKCLGQGSCLQTSDCPQNATCIEGSCVIAHCYDGIKNYDETATDCGGKECPACAICGNGKVERGETCDGTDFGKITGCQDLDAGFVSGVVSCNSATCHFDTSKCVLKPGVCGDGVISYNEQCEGSVVNAQCTNFGFTGGALSCRNCRYDTSACQGSAGTCGDKTLNPGEQCEIPPVAFGEVKDRLMPLSLCKVYSQALSISPYFIGGNTKCVNCQYIADECIQSSVCGDNKVSHGEECDTSISQVATCSDFDSFFGGRLACRSCKIDTSSCYAPFSSNCGDGILDAGEECDNKLPVMASCRKFDHYLYGTVLCDENCRYSLERCSRTPLPGVCGDNVVDSNLGEQCDGTAKSATCESLGLGSGIINCNPPLTSNSCKFDTSSCTQQCTDGATINCINISAVEYSDGFAVCKNKEYNTSRCYPASNPFLALTSSSTTVDSSVTSVTGNVSGAKYIEVYVNGVHQKTYPLSLPSSQSFTIHNITLPNNNLLGSGLNTIKVIAYGGSSQYSTTTEYTVNVVLKSGTTIIVKNPSNHRTSLKYPMITISTDNLVKCTAGYFLNGVPYSNEFITNNVKMNESYLHEVILSTEFPPEQSVAVIIKCVDPRGNIPDAQIVTEIIYDDKNPVILRANLNGEQALISTSAHAKSVIIYTLLNHHFTITSSELVRCYYGFSPLSITNDFDLAAQGYTEIWRTQNRLVSQSYNAVVYFQCIDQAGLRSDPFTFSINTDPNYPINISTNSPNYVNVANPLMTFDINRNASCNAKYGSTTFQIPALTSTELGYQFSIQAKDLGIVVQNTNSYDILITCRHYTDTVSPATKTFTLYGDFTIPTITLYSPQAGETVGKQVIPLVAKTESNAKVSIELNGQKLTTFITANGNINHTLTLVSGSNNISISAIDRAGNTDDISTTVTYFGPEYVPRIISTTPSSGSTTAPLTKISAKVFTAHGLDLNRNSSSIIVTGPNGLLRINQVTFIPGSSPDYFGTLELQFASPLVDGPYQVQFDLIDAINHRMSSPVTITFTVNQNIPVITVRSPLIISTRDNIGENNYRTSNTSFILSGTIQSGSTLANASCNIYSLATGQFSKSVPLSISTISVDGAVFNQQVTLDQINPNEEKKFTARIVAQNVDGYQAQLEFVIIHDRKAPIPITVTIK